MSAEGTSLGQGQSTRETERAVLVELESGEEVWIPKSVIHDDSEVWGAGQAGDVIVMAWFAEKEGLG